LRTAFESQNRSIFSEIAFHDFLDKASDETAPLVIHSRPLLPSSPFGSLLSDVDTFPFLPRLTSSRRYPRYRAFFYRNSYTDWHYHPVDEALMSQIVGTKEVLLLPPDSVTWNALTSVLRRNSHMCDFDFDQAPEFKRLRPHRVLVTPGDALYIPAFWWHAVESVEDKFGITVATTFRTPLQVCGDLSFPAARRIVLEKMVSPSAPFALLAAIYAQIYRGTSKVINSFR
jgi:hypothetical protein